MKFAYAALAALLSISTPGWAEGYILDSESTAYFQKLARPLQPFLPHTQNIHFLLVADPNINAYVDNDKIIHLNSGLLLRASNVDEVRGVIAHEMGHVAAQHIFRMQGDKSPMIAGIAGAVLGVGTMAAGAPQAGAAILTGGGAAGLTMLLRHSRQNEMEADNRAVQALHGAGYGVGGMATLFGKLRTEMQLSYKNPPPYLLTHPMPAERMQNLQLIAAREPSPTQPPADDKQFKRIQARIYALSYSPAETLRKYADNSEASRYARAIALAQQGKVADAKKLMDGLLAEHPKDYFYRGTAADLAEDRGDLQLAKTLLEQLVREDSSQTLLQYQLGDILRNLDQPAAALPHLEQATRDWPAWPEPWRSLGVVYGQLGRLSEGQLALAEFSLQSGDKNGAEQHLKTADIELKKKPDPKLSSWRDDIKDKIKDLPTS
ncbi:MAG TPA: M48 family metalloprotease [Alphaproteobacteria bacterium]|nr:M48 family metalloprotease [Alphaproteobacteria bacterium]